MQGKPDKLEMSKLFYFVHIMLMRMALNILSIAFTEYFVDCFYRYYENHPLLFSDLESENEVMNVKVK